MDSSSFWAVVLPPKPESLCEKGLNFAKEIKFFLYPGSRPIVSTRPSIPWKGLIIGCGTGLVVYRIIDLASKRKQARLNDRQRADAAETLLALVARFGCDKRENYHDLLNQGWTHHQMIQPDVDQRLKEATEDMEKRFKEGTPTEQDRKWKKRQAEETMAAKKALSKRNKKARREQRKREEELAGYAVQVVSALAQFFLFSLQNRYGWMI